MGGGADEADDAALDIGEEDVLLGFVESVDFVDEEDGADAGGLEAIGGAGDDAAHIRDAALDAAEALETGFGGLGDDLGQGGFADAGRAEEDDRGDAVGLDGAAEELAGAEDVLLAGVFLEGAGAHAGGEGGGARRRRAGEWGPRRDRAWEGRG